MYTVYSILITISLYSGGGNSVGKIYNAKYYRSENLIYAFPRTSFRFLIYFVFLVNNSGVSF